MSEIMPVGIDGHMAGAMEAMRQLMQAGPTEDMGTHTVPPLAAQIPPGAVMGGPSQPPAQPAPPPLQPPNDGRPEYMPGVKVSDLNPHFHNRLSGLINAVKDRGGELYVFSGARHPTQQHQLFQQAVAKYGDESIAKKYVAKAGESTHEHAAGLRMGIGHGAVGADLRGDLALAYKLAPLYGLSFTSKESPWHIQVAQ